jgi:hypothetical protein
MSATGTTGYTHETYMPEQAKGWMDRCCDDLAHAVDENPAGSLMTAFGVGMGIGVALGLTVALSAAAKPKPRSRAEEIGQRVLESLQDMLPESIAKRMR